MLHHQILYNVLWITDRSADHYAQYETINGNEPYYSNWLKKDKHLITSFQELNNLPVQESLPEI